MADAPTTPVEIANLKATKNPDGSITASGSVQGVVFTATRATNEAVTVSFTTPPPTAGLNWQAILQAVLNALPAILAIIAAFTGA